MSVSSRTSAGSVTATLTGGDVETTVNPYSTATRTSVNDAASDTLLLAANANRRFASVHNNSTEILYLGLGTTAVTTTNFTARLTPQALYELPVGFTGQVRGIWAADGSGAAIMTECT